jgi:hypothetical protein
MGINLADVEAALQGNKERAGSGLRGEIINRFRRISDNLSARVSPAPLPHPPTPLAALPNGASLMVPRKQC